MWKLAYVLIIFVIARSVNAEKVDDLTDKVENEETSHAEPIAEDALSKTGEENINDEIKEPSIEKAAKDIEDKSAQGVPNPENESADSIQSRTIDATQDKPIEEKSGASRRNYPDNSDAIEKTESNHNAQEKTASETKIADVAEDKMEEDHAEASANHETSYIESDVEFRKAPDIDFDDIPLTRRRLTNLDDIIDMKARSGKIDEDDEVEEVKSVPVSHTRQWIEPTKLNTHSFRPCSSSCFNLNNEMLPRTYPTTIPRFFFNPSKLIQQSKVGRHNGFENLNMQPIAIKETIPAYNRNQNNAQEFKPIDDYNHEQAANAYPYAATPKETSLKSLSDINDYNNILAKLTQASEHPVANINQNIDENFKRYMNHYTSLDPNHSFQNYDRYVLPRYRRLSFPPTSDDFSKMARMAPPFHQF